jgi:hypothetical protein
MSDENSHRTGFPNEQPPVSVRAVVKLFSLKRHFTIPKFDRLSGFAGLPLLANPRLPQ